MPGAAQNLHVGAATRRRDGAGGALMAVDLAGEERLDADGVVLDLERLDLETFALEEAALGRHVEEARIGLRRNQRVTPGLEFLRRGGARNGCDQMCRERESARAPRQSCPQHEISRLIRGTDHFSLPLSKAALHSPKPPNINGTCTLEEFLDDC